MKHWIVGGLTSVLMAGGLIAFAPPASAGCLYGGWTSASRCDGPVQPDGTWQRCVVFDYVFFDSSNANYGNERCETMGPGIGNWGMAFNDPPTHIDDVPGEPAG